MRSFLLWKKDSWIFQRFERNTRILWSLALYAAIFNRFERFPKCFKWCCLLQQFFKNLNEFCEIFNVSFFWSSSSWILWWFLKIVQESLLFLHLQSSLPQDFEHIVLCFLAWASCEDLLRVWIDSSPILVKKTVSRALKIRVSFVLFEDRVALQPVWRGLLLKLWYHDKLWSKKCRKKE